MKYFKIDKDKREIIIDKTRKYNVNVDILDLIINLQIENKILRENAEHNDKVVDKINWENNILNYRIKKAINILDRYGTNSYETADLLYSALRGNEE